MFAISLSVIWSDLKQRIIPNISVALLAVFGLVIAITHVSPLGVELFDSFLGCIIAFAFLLPFYLIGWMGAGDVKLAAALGFWLGYELLLPTWMLSVLMAVLYASFRQVPFFTKYYQVIDEHSSGEKQKRRFVPYGAMLCTSAFIIIGKQII